MRDAVSLTTIRSLARSHAPTAIASLAAIAHKCPSPSARVAACIALLDRGFGRPGLDDESAETLTITIRKIFEAAPMTTIEAAPLVEADAKPPDAER